MPDPSSWIIISLCVLGHFFFSLSETSLACCNRFKMQAEAENNSKIARIVVKLCEKYDNALTTVLVLNNIVAIALSTVSTLFFYNLLKDTALTPYASLLSSIAMTIIVYILGDTLPKTIARAIPDTTSKIVAIPIYGLTFICFPISIIFEGMVILIEKLFKNKKEETFTSEDLEKVLEKSEEEGMFEEETVEIIQSALDFADTRVKDVLTKRKDIFALDMNKIDSESLKKLIISTSYSRIPLYKDELDNYQGVLHVKTYIKEYLSNPNVKIEEVMQPPYKVDSSIMLVKLLEGFKKHHTHLAMVVNKDDHIIGMVTMEDVLEELVSDISEPNLMKKGAK